ncbi:MAG: substrate-binding domain-containing protein [Christensenellaceae bacterium]|nr:substrate-binding domain-containing protein [Christensenellaceae bacterium]
MKRIALLLLVAVMIAALVGCAQPAEQPAQSEAPAAPAAETKAPEATQAPAATEAPASEEPESEYKYPGAVGKQATMILKDLTNPVWLEAREGGLAAAEEFGMDLEVVAPIESNNNEEQIALVQQVIAQKKDILIMCPADSTGIVPAIEEVNAANIPVINLNTKINTDSGTVHYETFVVADNTICGTLCAEELVRLAGEEGEAVILEGPSGGQVTIDLSNAAQAVFKKYPNIKLVDIQNAKFDRATAFNTTQNLLQAHPNLKIIFSCNDEMALGAVEALKEAGKLDQVVVGGIDGNQDALKAIKEGTMEVTVYKNFWLQAYTAVEAAAKFLDGQKLDEKILVELEAVTPANVDKYLKN